MIEINDTLISEEIIEKDFVCNLDACKGACCVEGDAGAPVEQEEVAILERIYPKVAPLLSAGNRPLWDRASLSRGCNRLEKAYLLPSLPNSTETIQLVCSGKL